MHVVIDFDVLYHLAAVSLESAVEIVQIDAGEFARRGVKELRREVFRQAIVISLLFPARDDVVAVFADHAIEFGNLVGAVLQIRVHGDHHVALRAVEAAMERRRLAVVASKFDSLHMRRLSRQAFDDAP